MFTSNFRHISGVHASISRPRLRAAAIIPARGGSKGLPRKNILELGGKPLVAWSIESALRCGGFDRVLVSTDDSDIADISKYYGAEVPFLRPALLSQDHSSPSDATTYTFERLKEEDGYLPDVVVTLFPTSPFRKDSLMHSLMQAVWKGCHVVTVRRIRAPLKGFWHLAGDSAIRHVPLPSNAGPCWQRPYGLFLASQWGASEAPWHVQEITEPAALLDVDHAVDLEQARQILAQGLFVADN